MSRHDDHRSDKFSQARIERCMEIGKRILMAAKFGEVDLVVHPTEHVMGRPFEDIKKMYFKIGVGTDVSEVPFEDAVLILSFVDQGLEVQKSLKPHEVREGEFRFSTAFSDEYAIRLFQKFARKQQSLRQSQQRQDDQQNKNPPAQ